MIIVNIHEAKTTLSKLLTMVEQQNEIVRICRHGKAVAQIVPMNKQEMNPMQTHHEISDVTLLYDPTEPLSEDEWPENLS